MLEEEFTAARGFARDNRNEILVICLATLFLIISRYHRFQSVPLRYLVYYAGLPLLSIVLLLRKHPLDFGLRIGDARLWGIHVAIGCLLSFAVIIAGLLIPGIGTYYAEGDFDLAGYLWRKTIILLCLEFFYRGFLLFGLRDRFKEGAVLVQMVPFAILHIGKPEIEAVGCIVAGLYFGYVAFRTNSMWPAFLIHLFANVLNRMVYSL